ncbi:MAG: PfkB family carbohydrate kinase [Promethearchaeia archaeon]
MSEVIVTLGELLLRLKSPDRERFFQQPLLEATFGGSEANVAISLANYGVDARFVTALPDNPIGDAAVRFVRSMKVDVSQILRQGPRVGIYYLEAGSGPRPSNVIYDRAHSSISEAKPADFNWDAVFQDASWFHISGITPALSQNAADLSIAAAKEAKKQGLTVSSDLNYRSKLWNYGKTAPEIMTQMIKYIDVVIGNEEDVQKCLGLELGQDIVGEELSHDKYEKLGEKVFEKFPHVKYVGTSLREAHSADYNEWSAMLYPQKLGKALFSEKYQLTDIVDRVGGGDSFGAALIYGLFTEMDDQDALEFAVAASALKHTIPGDVNRVSVEEVKKLLESHGSGRIER